jgi:aminoglycoside phosphotransferase family enzyme/predicted kinase
MQSVAILRELCRNNGLPHHRNRGGGGLFLSGVIRENEVMAAPVSEDSLIRFMLDPTTYPHQPATVRLIQTHASLVFVASPFVYKVKKPVDFGFLDFTSLEKRRHFCERELRLNQRLCPEGYLDVIPITVKAGKLALGGEGEEVEVALRMREFSPDGFFDQKVTEGRATAADMDRIVSVLATFYLEQHPTAEIEQWGRIEKLRLSTDENFSQTKAFIGKTLPASSHDAIRRYTDRFYKAHSAWFDERVEQGWIRDCHGDLHLEHIHLTPEHLHIYDCIEFNDRFREVDVASDAAFLAMDLDFRGARDLSRHFVETLQTALKDRRMADLMPFYRCYRAYVRGKVESLRSESPDVEEAERKEATATAQRYFSLALTYAVAGLEPMIIAVMGQVASGKSTLASALSSGLGWPVFSSDRIRKELAGIPLGERVGDEKRSELYSRDMSARTYAEMERRAVGAARCKGGAIMDATFSLRAGRESLRMRMREAGVTIVFVLVEAERDCREERLVERVRACSVSDARLEDRRRLDAGFEGLGPDEQGDTLTVISTSGDPAVDEVLCELAERSATRGCP